MHRQIARSSRPNLDPIIRVQLRFTHTSLNKLRYYQQDCIDICISKLKSGVKRQAVSLPVGSGKTFTFSHLIQQVPIPKPGATKTLVLAHRAELLQQAYHAIKSVAPHCSVSIDQGIQKPSNTTEVCIASVPALGRLGGSRIKRYNPDEFKCIIIDEAHHSSSESYIRTLQHFGALNADSHIFLWGCSATLRRNDSKSLNKIYNEITYSKTFPLMIKEKWLCNFKLKTVCTTTSLKGLKSHEGDFVQSELSKRIDNDGRNRLIVSSYLDLIAKQGYKSTLVFATNIQHVESLVQCFKSQGISCAGVHSKISVAERFDILSRFSNKFINVIVNCSILTEGVDIPRTDSLLLARPTKSTILLQQIIGRGLRLFPGKEHCMIIDFVDIVDIKLLATVPTLFGLKADFDFKGVDALTIHEEIESKNKESEEMGNVNSHSVGEIRARVSDYGFPLNCESSNDAYLEKITPFRWVRTSPTRYSLTIEKSKSLNVTIEDGQYKVYLQYLMVQRNSFYHKKIYIATEETLENAFSEANIWIAGKFGLKELILYRNAPWRKLPATLNQIDALLKKNVYIVSKNINGNYIPLKTTSSISNCGVFVILKDESQLPTYLDRGMASDLILKLSLGTAKKFKQYSKTLEDANNQVIEMNRIQHGSLD